MLHNILYVYGGLDERRNARSDLYALDCDLWAWQKLGNFAVEGNDIRVCGHSAVVYQDKVLIFGGLDPASTTIYNQIFVYYATQHIWGRLKNTKAPRFCGSIAIKNRQLLIFAGCNLVNRQVPVLESISLDSLDVDLLD
jgi:N-acetylneuraminic acid mutarotase